MPVKLNDNSLRDKHEFAEIPNLTDRIADKTLEQLERDGVFVFPELIKESDDLSGEQMILQSVNDFFYTSNVMGFLGYGDERLAISSRFSGAGDDFFLWYLLEQVCGFKNIVDLRSDADQDNRLFSFLLFLFPYYLRKATRKGLFKKYIRREYNDGHVKGSINIPRHIKDNTPCIGSVA